MEMECTPIPERDLQFGPPKRNRIGTDSARKNEAINPSIMSIKPILGFNTKKCKFQLNLPCCWIQPVLQSSIPFYLLNLLYHSIISLSWRKQLDQVTSQATSQPTSSSSSRKRFRSRSWARSFQEDRSNNPKYDSLYSKHVMFLGKSQHWAHVHNNVSKCKVFWPKTT